MANIKAKVAQVTPAVVGEGDFTEVKSTKLGALFTADWKQQLVLAGLAWQVDVGTVTASGDIAPVTGGGNGTTIDFDQPELAIGVDAGYYLIPLEARCAIQVDNDADVSEGNIILIADRSAAPPTSNASATTAAPVNMLDGAASFPGRAFTGSTGNITTPVASQILDFVTAQASTMDSTGMVSSPVVKMDYVPSTPTILAGPCQVVMCFGGTKAAVGIGSVVVACVPASYFPVS